MRGPLVGWAAALDELAGAGAATTGAGSGWTMSPPWPVTKL